MIVREVVGVKTALVRIAVSAVDRVAIGVTIGMTIAIGNNRNLGFELFL